MNPGVFSTQRRFFKMRLSTRWMNGDVHKNITHTLTPRVEAQTQGGGLFVC